MKRAPAEPEADERYPQLVRHDEPPPGMGEIAERMGVTDLS